MICLQTRHCLLVRRCRLVVVLPLVAPPSCLPWLVVASNLVALPQSLDTPAPASQSAVALPCARTTTSHLPLVRNTPPTPCRLFFLDARRQQMSGCRLEQCLVFGGLVCCELAPHSRHKIVSCEPHLCKLAKSILWPNTNTNTNTNSTQTQTQIQTQIYFTLRKHKINSIITPLLSCLQNAYFSLKTIIFCSSFHQFC